MIEFVPASELYDPSTGERVDHPATQVDRGDGIIADGGLEHECEICGSRYYSRAAAESCCGFRSVIAIGGGDLV